MPTKRKSWIREKRRTHASIFIPTGEWPGCEFSEGWRGGLREVTLEEFNALPVAQAEEFLLDCCGSTRWASRISERRPFAGLNILREAADSIWQDLESADWLEAFGRHPQIGEKAATGSEASRQWSEGEQASAQSAAENTMERLAEGNRAYREKFGY